MALELVQPAARDERADDRVERVLGRGADQRHEPGLDDRQERVLLRLVEAVDLVDEEHGPPALRAQPLARAARSRPGRRPCPRRPPDSSSNADCVLAATMRASVVLPVPGGPKKMRRGDAVLLDRPAQRRALADELRLAGELVERPRAQAVGQRRMRRTPFLGRIVEQAHGGTGRGSALHGRVVLEQAEPRRLARGVEARPAAERDQRVADVHVDRAHGEEELGGDLAVRAPFGDAPDDLQLPRRQAGGGADPAPAAAELGERRARPPPAAGGRRAGAPAGARRRATRGPARRGRRRARRRRR